MPKQHKLLYFDPNDDEIKISSKMGLSCSTNKPYSTIVCNWLILEFYLTKQNVKQNILDIVLALFVRQWARSASTLGITCQVAVYKVQCKVVVDKTFFENTRLT